MSEEHLRQKEEMRKAISYIRLKDFKLRELVKKDDGSWQFEIKTIVCGWDGLLNKWEKVRTETTYEPIDKELFKKIEFDVLFVREALEPKTLKSVRGYFSQHVRAEIPSLEMFADYYFSLCENKIWIHLLPNQTMEMSLSFGKETPYGEFLHKLGEPERLSPEEALELSKKPDCLSLYFESESGDYTTKIVWDAKVKGRR